MNPAVHFEMLYDDCKRMAAFYRSSFGWKFGTQAMLQMTKIDVAALERAAAR